MTESTSPSLRLRVVKSPTPGYEGQIVTLEGAEHVVGREPGCDLRVPDSSVSRKHALLTLREDGGLLLADQGSANGTFFQGQRIKTAEVNAGGSFRVGQTTYELLGEEDEPEEEAPGEAFYPDRTMSFSGIAELAVQFERPQPLPELGQEMITAANRPFLLEDPTSMWLVEDGKIEIFMVAVEGGAPTGARTHFLTVEPGEAFFGLDTRRFGHDSGFLAVGKAGSKLRRFDVDRLQTLAAIPEHREMIGRLVAGWVAGLSRRLTEDVTQVPTPDVGLREGEEVELEGGQTAAANVVQWLDMPASLYLFDGMATLSYEVEGILFPLAPGSWIEVLSGEDAVTIHPRLTEESVDEARLWAGLDVFHRVLCECEFLNKKLAEVDEYLRLEKKAEQVEQAQEAALGAIGSVLGGTKIWDVSALGQTEVEPVLKACELVGAALQIQVRNHPHAREGRSFEEALIDIGMASRFRVRRVKMVDDWWNHDHGPILGQREETNAPVAILPTSPTSYRYVDTQSGESGKITEEVAATIVAFGYTFYAPLPDGKLSAKELIRFGVRGLGPEFRTVAFMGVGVGLLGMVTPMITGMVFDTAIPQAERGMLIQFCFGLLLVALGTSAFKITQNVAMLRVQGMMDLTVQAAVWDRLLDLPLTFFRKYSSGDLADRAAGVDAMRSIIAGAGVSAILGTLASSFNAIQMCFYSFAMAGVGIALTLFYVFLTTGANFLQLRLQREEMQRRGRITGLVLQLISGVSKLRVSGAENHAFRVWATAFSGQRKVSFGVGRVQNFMMVFNSGYPTIANMVIFSMMAYLQTQALEKGEAFDMTTGDFLAFSAAFGVFLGAMQSLGDASLSVLKIVPVYERLEPILTEAPEVDESKAAPGKLKGGIDISRVSFRYTEDGPWILKDVSLKLLPGQFVAFVGGSGSGKSTLMRLMLGFEQPEMGSVYYDGQDLATLDLRMVRQQLGVVLQDSRLLPADIYRNIVGASSRTVEEAWEAARKAGLADDIKAMPMGMHTYVSEGGGGFSGGQKQRLMIARALVHQPKILYLDEATSALDNRTQAIVTESMDRLQATRIVIAHRLSTIINADQICYLDQGKIAEVGSYEELMEKDGLFAELARRQQA